MIRSFAIFILSSFIPATALFAQDISEKYPDVIKRVKSINSDSSLTKIVLTNEEFMPQVTDGGGELIGYFKKQEIQKITRTIGLSYGIKTYDYYFSYGRLLFIYETLYGFATKDTLGTLDYNKTELNFIGRYYFKKDKLIDNETTGHNRFERDDVDMEKVLLQETKENLLKLKYKRNNVP
ncbi:MAG TPA: hypothetical protein VFH08_16735 [Chitinophagaceae bacterium]|nr:hypothetical protein [Chitinophagaceae bacterium]